MSTDCDATIAMIRRLAEACRAMKDALRNHPPPVVELDIQSYRRIKNTKPIRNHRLRAICQRAANALGTWAEGTGEEAALTFPMQELAKEIAALDDDIAAGRAKAK